MSPKFFCRHKRRIIIIIMTDVRHLCSDFEFYLHWSLCMKAILGKNAPFIQVVGFRFEFLFYFFIFLFFFNAECLICLFYDYILTHIRCEDIFESNLFDAVGQVQSNSCWFAIFPIRNSFQIHIYTFFFLLWKYSTERWKSSRSANDELEWFCVTFNYNNTFLDKIEYFRTEIDHLHTKLTFPNTDRILIARNVV